MDIRSIFYQKIGKCRRCDIIIKYWAILRTFVLKVHLKGYLIRVLKIVLLKPLQVT